jgi:hypothetical protein
MSTMQTIEIDFDVHKCIEMERQNFDESPNAALRRLLGLDRSAAPPAPRGGRPWRGKPRGSLEYVILEHSTALRMSYNGRQHTGQIDDGEWLVEGRRYRSPSAAAGGVGRTKEGKRTSLDGWRYWEFRRPGETEWRRLELEGVKPLATEDL